ncbi:MAG: N-acetylmuramoyl-L-alanine amidase [Meiothermus sp.]
MSWLGVRAQDASSTALLVPRIGDHPGFTRVVFDLPAGATYTLEPLGAALRLNLPGQTVTPGIVYTNQPELAGYVMEQFEDHAGVLFMTSQGVSERSGYKLQELPALEGDGKRLVIDLSGAFVDTSPFVPPASFSFVKAKDRRFSVVLDPGHGGPDTGAQGLVVEKEVNLEVAKRVAALLQGAGVEVILTRSSDTAFSADKRTDLTARVNLAKGKSVYISIHSNATEPPRSNWACGLEVYYYGPGNARVVYPPALPLLPAQTVVAPPAATPDALQPDSPSDIPSQPTEIIPPSPLPLPSVTPQMSSARRMEQSRTLASRVMSYLLSTTAGLGRGVRTADYFVNKFATVPSILVEMGYVTHPLEGLNLRNSDYRDRIAYGIARGVLEYLENDYPSE